MERKQEKLKEKILQYMSGLTEAIPMDRLYEKFSVTWNNEADLYCMREVHGATMELISSGGLVFCDHMYIATPRLKRVLEAEKGKAYREGETLAAFRYNDGENILEGIWLVTRDFNEGVMRKVLKRSYDANYEPAPCVFQLLAQQGFIKAITYRTIHH